MSLTRLEIKTEYRKSDKDWIIEEFLIPILKEGVSYRRAVGYFSSTALANVVPGIAGLFANKSDAVIQLVASPALSEEDVEAIKKGINMRDVVASSLQKDLLEPSNYFEQDRLNLLAHLIADHRLEIKIAIVKGKNGEYGIFHEKIGIVEDSDGNIVAFTGSMNATGAGHMANYESVDAYCSWNGEDSRIRCEDKLKAFDNIWNNLDSQLEVLDFPEIEESIIQKYKRYAPNYNIDEEEFGRYPRQNNKAKGPRIPEKVELYEYQKEAIANWEANNYRGIFDMATGTGKTYTGLAAISTLSEALEDKLAVFIVCPLQHLVEQWVEDIELFGMKPIVGYSASPQKNWRERLKQAVINQKIRKDSPFFCFVTTNATFSGEYVQSIIQKIKTPILLVIDEAHNFGAETYAPLLDDRFDYRLALSATLERHGDEKGTKALLDFFGEKCISYSLKRAIKEGKLTPYKYYPIIVYLDDEELLEYEKLSFELSKHVIKLKDGTTKLDKQGEIIAIQRSRVVAAASGKLSKLTEVIEPYKDDHYILVYCGATNVVDPNKDRTETNEKDIKQIYAVSKILGNTLGMKVARFTAEEDINTRATIKAHFQTGDDLQAIVAIKCLDEGVNIPGIKTAFILASTTNPKEYIQRRGRVLRKAKGKDFAEIYDFVTLPRELDKVFGLTEDQRKRDETLVKNEIARMKEFGDLSMNSLETSKKLWNIAETYSLDEYVLSLEDNYE